MLFQVFFDLIRVGLVTNHNYRNINQLLVGFGPQVTPQLFEQHFQKSRLLISDIERIQELILKKEPA